MNKHQCPQNKSEWDTASQRLQCVDPNSYHCLLTQDGDGTEQCLGRVWIQEGMCPEYNSKVGKIDVFSCSHMPGCPTKIYWSNDVYQYNICSYKTSSATTTASSDFTESSEEQSLPLNIIIPVAIVVLLVLLVLGIYMYIKRRKGQNNKKDKQRKDENQLTTFGIQVSEDTQSGSLLTKDKIDEQSDSLCQKYKHSVDIHLSYPRKVERVRSNTTSKEYTSLMTSDIRKSDVKYLKENGTLIFISSDKSGIGQRMMDLADCGEFGQSRYEHSLNLWEPEKDVSLYLFIRPLEGLTSLLTLNAGKIEDMYRKVREKSKTYFVLYFTDGQWQTYGDILLEYDLFNNAQIIEV